MVHPSDLLAVSEVDMQLVRLLNRLGESYDHVWAYHERLWLYMGTPGGSEVDMQLVSLLCGLSSEEICQLSHFSEPELNSSHHLHA